ncbi:PAS domain S-box protein [Bacillus sp. B15-48]|uniref:PAS domain S-box protein n=1 Tax=Bacillus sp. B15-48 TaxID=1548601 RepID=UPI00193FB893|nr:PAS domain S-box protein [Bacillus sp. B15-48]MBM4763204.1 PAS domain S-box protein [Bacillus sp. B15-48]
MEELQENRLLNLYIDSNINSYLPVNKASFIIDLKGKLVFVNMAYEKLTGYAKRETDVPAEFLHFSLKLPQQGS